MKEQETDLEHPISKCNGNPFVAEKKKFDWNNPKRAKRQSEIVTEE